MGWSLRRFGSFLVAATLLAIVAVGLGHQRLRQGPVSLGAPTAALIARQLEAGAQGLEFAIGDVVFALGEPGRASGLILRQVQLRGAEGDPIAFAPELSVDFRLVDVLRGRLEPTRLRVSGASLHVLRDALGRFSLDPAEAIAGQAAGAAGGAATPGRPADGDAQAPPRPRNPAADAAEAEGPGLSGFLALLDRAARGEGPLGRLSAVSARDLEVIVHDRLLNRTLRVEQAQLEVSLEDGREVAHALGRLALGGASPEGARARGGAAPAEAPMISLRGERERDGGAIRVRLSFQDLPLSDLSLAPALGLLAQADSPASGLADLTLSGGGAPQRASLRVALGAGTAPFLPAPFDRLGDAEARLDWSAEDGVMRIRSLSAQGPAGAVELSGALTPWPRPRGAQAAGAPLAAPPPPRPLLRPPEGWRLDLDLARLRLAPIMGFEAPLGAEGGHISADLIPGRNRIELAALSLPLDLGEAGALRLQASGQVEFAEDGPRAALRFDAAEPFSLAALRRAWPLEAAPGARDWVVENIREARLSSLRGAVWAAPGEIPELSVDFGFEGLSSTIVEGMPPVEGAAGRGRITLNRFDMRFDQARATPPGGEAVDLAGSSFSIPDVVEDPQPAAPVIRARGRIVDILGMIDQPPLRLTRRLDADLGGIQGEADVTARLAFRLLNDLDLDDIQVAADARLNDVAMTLPGGARRLSARMLELSADISELTLSGAASIDGIGAQVRWQERFSAALPPEDRRRIEARARLDAAALKRLELGGALEITEGAAIADLTLTGPDDGGGIALRVDLGPAGLRAPELGWRKAAGTAGRFEAQGRRQADGGLRLSRLELEAPELSLRGSGRLDGSGALRRLTLERLRLEGAIDATVAMELDAQGVLQLELGGDSLDIAGFSARRDRLAAEEGAAEAGPEAEAGENGGAGALTGATAGLPEMNGRIQVARATLIEGIALEQAQGRMTRQRGVTAVRLSGAVNGGAEARLRYREGRRGGVTLSLRSQDAGRLLSDLGITEAVHGGALRVRGRIPPRQSAVEGVAELRDLRVAGRQALEGVVSAARNDGLLRAQEDDEGGYGFDRVEAPFRLQNGVVTLTDALATGPLLGLKVNGDYQIEADRLNLTGVLTPAYAVNGLLNGLPLIGDLLGGEGEGLFAMNFTVKGDAADPEISANPLSILTPGLLRRLLVPADDAPARPSYPDLFENDER